MNKEMVSKSVKNVFKESANFVKENPKKALLFTAPWHVSNVIMGSALIREGNYYLGIPEIALVATTLFVLRRLIKSESRSAPTTSQA